MIDLGLAAKILAAATAGGFAVLVTTHRNLRYRQNLENRTIAIVVLMTASWPRLAKQTVKVAKVIGQVGAGE